MFSRLLVRSGGFVRHTVRPVSWAMAGVMAAGFIQIATPPASAEAKPNRPSTSDASKVLPKRDPLPAKPKTANPAVAAASTAPAKVTWPAAGAADITVPAPASARSTAGSSKAPAATAKIGGLPVAVSAAPAAAAAAPDSARPAASAPGKVRIEVLDRKASEKAKVDGPIVRLDRADGQAAAGNVRLDLGYGGVAGAFGGDFGARLRLVRLPECALTTPEKAQCAPVPLPTTNDSAAETLSAEAGTGALFAMTATDSSSQGDYGATKLSPSSKWSVAPSTGGFSWSYPLRSPRCRVVVRRRSRLPTRRSRSTAGPRRPTTRVRGSVRASTTSPGTSSAGTSPARTTGTTSTPTSAGRTTTRPSCSTASRRNWSRPVTPGGSGPTTARRSSGSPAR